MKIVHELRGSSPQVSVAADVYNPQDRKHPPNSFAVDISVWSEDESIIGEPTYFTIEGDAKVIHAVCLDICRQIKSCADHYKETKMSTGLLRGRKVYVNGAKLVTKRGP